MDTYQQHSDLEPASYS